MRERMLAGEPYLFDSSLDDDTRRCRRLLQTINAATPDQDDERDAALRELLGAFGEDSNIRPPFRCEYGYQIHVGERVFANFGLVCLDVARITIRRRHPDRSGGAAADPDASPRARCTP